MSLLIITGPMFSGKTTELIKILKHKGYNRKTVLFKNKIDTRETEENLIKSRQGTTYPVIMCESSEEILKYSPDYDLIGIDEGHFWENIEEVVEEMIKNGKDIIIAFLNGDYNLKAFSNSHGLFAKATKILHLSSFCEICGEKAYYNKKRITRKIDTITVGGAEIFYPVCVKHFFAE